MPRKRNMVEEFHLDPQKTYSAKDVARLIFGCSIGWFYKHRQALERDEAFPPPISKYGPARYSGHSLITWINRNEPDQIRQRIEGRRLESDQRHDRILKTMPPVGT